MPDHAVLYNRSPISDRRVNNNYKLVYVAAIIGMIEVRLHYDQIAGAIEILQVYTLQKLCSCFDYLVVT